MDTDFCPPWQSEPGKNPPAWLSGSADRIFCYSKTNFRVASSFSSSLGMMIGKQNIGKKNMFIQKISKSKIDEGG